LAPIVDNAGGASSVTYNGAGTLILGAGTTSGTQSITDDSSTFTNDFVVNSGTVSVKKEINPNNSGGGLPLLSSPLGSRAVARKVIVNSGAILSFDIGNELGGGYSTSIPPYPLMTFVVNQGGTLRATTSNRTHCNGILFTSA